MNTADEQNKEMRVACQSESMISLYKLASPCVAEIDRLLFALQVDVLISEHAALISIEWDLWLKVFYKVFHKKEGAGSGEIKV